MHEETSVVFQREPIQFVSKDKLTQGEQFIKRRKKTYQPSFLFILLVGIVLCAFVVIEFDVLPRIEGQEIQAMQPEVTMTNKDACQQLMDGTYMGTADMFLYCQKLWPTMKSVKI